MNSLIFSSLGTLLNWCKDEMKQKRRPALASEVSIFSPLTAIGAKMNPEPKVKYGERSTIRNCDLMEENSWTRRKFNPVMERTRNKVTCCHFSSDGKLLTSVRHDKKVVLWSMDTLKTETTLEEHQYLITDVRFRPNSSQLATASFDKSLRLWDAANPSYCLNAYTGHPNHVISLDFYPKKNDLFCFCDSNNEIRYWNINPFTCARVSKVGFCDAFGEISTNKWTCLGGHRDKVVSIFDVETDRQTHAFQGHSGVVNYLCWDLNGDYLASVSEESAKVWSLTSRKCIHEISSLVFKPYILLAFSFQI
ncbi:hypothetical protein LOK49_LG14G01463 [Camellia lanceoleosa]|uniref:Uncharacterized protein n=1 Tax=Camellia lanceoleosa TaxID=1840588 RepID=A0ACC0F9C0_9ERIC|nr:hypothetical protein LOK49_LG14G01463 [Camellia lanceoleosa]